MLREEILNALKYFGPLNARELLDKLALRAIKPSMHVLGTQLRLLKRTGYIDCATGYSIVTYKIKR